MRKIIIASAFAYAVQAHTSAAAAMVWGWSINDPVQVVLPAETVIFSATLYNDISSTEHLYGANNRYNGYWINSASCCNADIAAQYVLDNPGIGGDVRVEPNFNSQFYDIDLAPGDSFNFVLLYLVPRYGSVTLGRYDFSARLGLTYLTSGVVSDLQYSDNSPSIIVSEVALPPAGSLLLGGLLPLLRRRRATNGALGNVA